MSFDGEKEAVCASQPEFMCSAGCLRLMIAVQVGLSQRIKSAPTIFWTTSEAGTNIAGYSSWHSLQHGQWRRR